MSNKIIRVEKGIKFSKDTFIFECNHPTCSKQIRIRRDYLKIFSGFCKSHVQKKRPFESIYNGLKNDHRNIKILLTFEEYLEFTKIKKCHYCKDFINWKSYGVENGVYKSRAYFLDRKNFSGPYSKENCVICCTKCNRARGNRYSYEEWFGMTKYLRDKSYITH